MEKAHALVNVRDINLICHYYKTYAQIEGVTRRRKITRSRRRSGTWKSEQQRVTNGYSLLHGSSWSMIWAFLSGIWPRKYDKSALVFSHRRTMETLGKIGEKNIPRLVKCSPRYLYWLLSISFSKSALSVPFLASI